MLNKIRFNFYENYSFQGTGETRTHASQLGFESITTKQLYSVYW